MIRSFGPHRPNFGQRVFVADTASVIGDVSVGDDVSIWYGAVLRGDVGKVRIGARTNVQDNATIHMTHETSDALIGTDVIIGHNAVVHGAVVEDRALVGMGATLMDNALVGEGAWIAAGSVVPPRARIAPYSLVRGAPASFVRELTDEERRWAREAIERYLGLAAEHKSQQLRAGVNLP